MRSLIFPLFFVSLLAATALAGDTDSPGDPGEGSDMPTLQEVYEYLTNGTGETPNASFEEPTAAPGSTMNSAREIYDAIEAERDTDLAAENIKKDVEIFGVTGTYGTTYPAPVPKTGNIYDGGHGVASPDPRFTNPDGTTPVSGDVVLDQLTGLMWTKDAGFGSTWASGKASCDSLNTGGYNDWRLPNLRELQSLIDYGVYGVTMKLPSGHPFSASSAHDYWSSVSYSRDTDSAWIVGLADGRIHHDTKELSRSIWPVRGGQ